MNGASIRKNGRLPIRKIQALKETGTTVVSLLLPFASLGLSVGKIEVVGQVDWCQHPKYMGAVQGRIWTPPRRQDIAIPLLHCAVPRRTFGCY